MRSPTITVLLDAEEDRPHVGAERLAQGQAALDGVGLSADAAGLALLARVVTLSRARARGEALGERLEAMGEPTPAEESHHMARAARLWVEAARAVARGVGYGSASSFKRTPKAWPRQSAGWLDTQAP